METIQNSTPVNWSETINKLPNTVKSIGSILLVLLKLPNFLWMIPGLSKLKGIRMALLTTLGSIHAVFLTIDIDMLSSSICAISDLMKWHCDSELIVSWFNRLMIWILAALAIEDKTR